MPEEQLLKDGERIDDLELSGLRIIQDPGRFCFGMDAVLLSGFVHASIGDRCLDIGTGTGIIPILMSAKTEAGHIIGLEIQPESAEMAARSVVLNGLSSKIEIINGDIREAASYFEAASFDVITSNPPYMIADHGIKNPDSALAIARHEVCATLEDIVKAAAHLVRTGGNFYMVHRPFRLAEIIRTLSAYNMEPKRMRFVYPYADKEPNMVLIQSVRGGKPRMQVDKPLIVFESQGVYSEEMVRDYGF
ncbi:MAG: tRNA1(Val) (adenine(37)-N6)-methyltransferase [Lachnospiraceae bacterium]|nr:tRNA1(Val) (adenine(37)-N6)-methyltransferase [Lachnospiraceae bacterium]